MVVVGGGICHGISPYHMSRGDTHTHPDWGGSYILLVTEAEAKMGRLAQIVRR